jgi:hypothetical protein
MMQLGSKSDLYFFPSFYRINKLRIELEKVRNPNSDWMASKSKINYERELPNKLGESIKHVME